MVLIKELREIACYFDKFSDDYVCCLLKKSEINAEKIFIEYVGDTLVIDTINKTLSWKSKSVPLTQNAIDRILSVVKPAEEAEEVEVEETAINTVKTTVKFNGLRDAVYALNHYKYVLVYFNAETREVWANEYADERSWTAYRNKNIHRLDFDAAYNYDDELCERVHEHFDSGKKFNCKLLNEIINAYIDYLEWWNKKMDSYCD